MSFKTKLTAVAIITASLNVNAAVQSFDSRSHAMGGVGVSSADYLTAPFHNPALGSRYTESDDIGLLIPSVGVQVLDQDEFIEGAEDFGDTFERFETLQGSLSGTSTVAEVTEAVEAANDVLDELEDLQGDQAFVQAGVGMAIAIPNQYLGVNLYTKAYADLFVLADISDSDLAIDTSDPLTGAGWISDPDSLTSQGVTMGVAILEGGVSLSKSFEIPYGTLYVGATPKYQMVNTINYVVDLDNYEFDDWDSEEYKNDEGNVNLDMGVAFELPQGWVFGLSARNLIENSYKTEIVSGVSGEYVINPVFTTGASFNHELFTAGIDIDLNETERYESFQGLNNTSIDGSGDNTQMAGVGVEFNAWGWAQLRAGYQHDIAGTFDDQFTAGLGLSPFNTIHIDVSASYAGENQFGAVVQTYATF